MDTPALVKYVMSKHSVKVKRQSAQVGVQSSQVKLAVLSSDSLGMEQALEGLSDAWVLAGLLSDDDGCILCVGNSDAEHSVLIRVVKSCILVDVAFDVDDYFF